jgi:hypothetical protein
MGWLKEEGFGGIMIWSVDMDDFRGSCGTGKYPLLNAMHKELEDYRVALEYEGPYESSNPGSKGYTTKDREYLPVKHEFYEPNSIIFFFFFFFLFLPYWEGLRMLALPLKH